VINSQYQKPFIPVLCLWLKENEPIMIDVAKYISAMKIHGQDVTVTQTGPMINQLPLMI